MPSRPTAPVLDRRTLNRTLLARQHLLERVERTPAAELEHLVGLQAQIPANPYLALWSRLAGFEAAALSREIEERRAVRLTLMRMTLHLVTARDAAAIRPVLAPHLARALETATPFGRRLPGIDREVLAAAGRAVLADRPLVASEAGRALAGQFPGADPEALGTSLQLLTPLAQVTPRGLWKRSGRPALAPAPEWLGLPFDADGGAPDGLVLRYLRAFGPAGVADIAAWSRLTGLREVVERLRPELRTFADERGRELFDVADGLLADPAAPAPVRFLPDYDNVLLGHEDRSRVIAEEDRRAIVLDNAFAPTVLVDGFVGATWRLRRPKGAPPVLSVAPLRGHRVFPAEERTAIEAEADRLLAFLEEPRAGIEISAPRLA